ncbi:hypothetical protein GCM10010191_80980 [Actinomadura vinacea]|uniref:Uncharacterized protein n=1 Tax=Actinomadura vinacea TaxID=115336 RepID=A0ABN3KA54_9ACTN
MATDPILSTDPIVSISANVWTGGDHTDGTLGNAIPDSKVFLGIAGREFRLARADIDDFQQYSSNLYIFGDGHNVERPEWNDPRDPQRTLGDLHNRPVYIRFEGARANSAADLDDWHLERVDVTVTAASGATVSYSALVGEPTIWLGDESGCFQHLDRQ